MRNYSYIAISMLFRPYKSPCVQGSVRIYPEVSSLNPSTLLLRNHDPHKTMIVARKMKDWPDENLDLCQIKCFAFVVSEIPL